MAIIETERLNGHNLSEGRNAREVEAEEVDRDPSRLPVNNLDAYKSWCQRVKADWDTANQ